MTVRNQSQKVIGNLIKDDNSNSLSRPCFFPVRAIRNCIAIRFIVLEHQEGDSHQFPGRGHNRHVVGLAFLQSSKERPLWARMVCCTLGRLLEHGPGCRKSGFCDRPLVAFACRLAYHRCQPKIARCMVAIPKSRDVAQS